MPKKKFDKRVEDLFVELQNGIPTQIGGYQNIPLKEEDAPEPAITQDSADIATTQPGEGETIKEVSETPEPVIIHDSADIATTQPVDGETIKEVSETPQLPQTLMTSEPMAVKEPGLSETSQPPPLVSKSDSTGKSIMEERQSLEQQSGISIVAPFSVRESEMGLIQLSDEQGNGQWREEDRQLVSDVASQLGLALENAQLYEKVEQELADRIKAEQAILRSNRNLAAIASAASLLSDQGTRALSSVLRSLGEATESHRTYFAQFREDDSGGNWRAVSEWISPSHEGKFDKSNTAKLIISQYPHWVEELHSKGWVISVPKEAKGAENNYLENQNISSALLIAVTSKTGTTPSFLAFEVSGLEKNWEAEEISALQVAADALTNTFTREGLLEQLQLSLDETENLYNASHRLAIATNLEEMLESLAFALNIPSINREVLVLFDRDSQNEIARMYAAATWYGGRGNRPPDQGSSYSLNLYKIFFCRQNPAFFDDIYDLQISDDIRKSLEQDKVGAIAVMPLWAGKNQIGVLLMECEDRHHFGNREVRTFPPLVDQMATGVENLRLFRQTQISLSETELLYKISTGVAQANNPTDLVDLVTKNILPRSATHVILASATSYTTGNITRLEFIADENIHGGSKKTGTLISIYDLPLLYNVSDDVLMIRDIRNTNKLDSQSQATLNKIGLIGACFVPLLSAGRFIGLLIVASDEPTEFLEDEIRLLKAAASGISIAMERQRLLREAQHRAFELQIAAEIARDTTSTLSLEHLMNRIVNQIRDRFNFYHVAIYLLDSTHSYATIQEATGDAGVTLKRNQAKFEIGSDTVIGTTAKTGETLIVNDVSIDKLFSPNPLLPKTQSEICLPLKIGDRVTGVVDIHSDTLNAFSQSEIAVLQILSDQITTSIENAKAYELSQKAVEELQEIDRIKTQFLANMSHELRTPLNSVIGFSRVILKGIDGPINDTQTQDLTAIYNSGQHLLSLINNILDLSKIEAGKMELQFNKVNMMDLINSALSTSTGLVKDKPIKLEQKVPADLPPVMADQTRIRQVLINFISNAVKFTDSGQIIVEASLIRSPDGKPEIQVTVEDTGAGIEEKDRTKLFQPFSQVDDSPTRKAGGTGLGLSISKSIIDLHHGRIGLLFSEPGKGSKFFFTLPVEEEAGAIPEFKPSPGSGTILAIDDNPDILNLYERYLKPLGYNVYCLTNPDDAVEVATKIKPFAITVDIMMPQRDGWMVMKDLKENPNTKDIPIIICSIVEEKEKGLKLGAADYLVKPFIPEDLIQSINRLGKSSGARRVLVIDDDVEELRLVEKILSPNENLKVVSVSSGQEGLDEILAQAPDVIVLDLFMPGIDGFTLFEMLQSDAKLKEIPVIFLTGADLTPIQSQLLAEFGQKLLTKGMLKEHDLQEALENALNRHKLK
jgi:signal transduction histidine kinase/DNA-binding response OmpR family regulator